MGGAWGEAPGGLEWTLRGRYSSNSGCVHGRWAGTKVGAGARRSFVLHPTGQSGSFLPTGDALCPLDVEGSQANIRPSSAGTADCRPPSRVSQSFWEKPQAHGSGAPGDSRAEGTSSTRSPRCALRRVSSAPGRGAAGLTFPASWGPSPAAQGLCLVPTGSMLGTQQDMKMERCCWALPGHS